jgi:Tfp pilus assembly ATPase PilU
MASQPVNTYIETMCPRLFADPSMDVYVELATDRTSQNFFGVTYYNYAIALRAMHNYTINSTRRRGEAGFITDRTEGRLSVRYLHNMSKNSRNDLMMTSYGQELHSLIRSLGPVASVAVGPNTLAALQARLGEF